MYPIHYLLLVLDMPKRPKWDYHMDKRQVEGNEESMFRKYIRDIKLEHPDTELSYFEMNLEVQPCNISNLHLFTHF